LVEADLARIVPAIAADDVEVSVIPYPVSTDGTGDVVLDHRQDALVMLSTNATRSELVS
jgi:hypothetical protein